MVNLALIQDWGTIDFFVLPGFRERTYSGKHGRFQPSFRFDKSAAEYQSAAEDKHVDYAIRYSTYIDVIDFGVYHFWGTSRELATGPPKVVYAEVDYVDICRISYRIINMLILSSGLIFSSTFIKSE